MLLKLQVPSVVLILVAALTRQEGVHGYLTRTQSSAHETSFGTLRVHGEFIQGLPRQRIGQLNEDESMISVQPSFFSSFSQVQGGRSKRATHELWVVVGVVFAVVVGAYLYYASMGETSDGAKEHVAAAEQVPNQDVGDRTPMRKPPPTKQFMLGYEDCDGSWARAYRQADDQRRQAIELIVRLGIISTDEFANSQTFPKHIEERIKVALMLLEQKPLSQWEQIGERAQGFEKESVLACFAAQGTLSATPQPLSPTPPQIPSPPSLGVRTPTPALPTVAAPAAEAVFSSPAEEPEPTVPKPATVEPGKIPPTAVPEEPPSVAAPQPVVQPAQGTASAPASSFGRQSRSSGGAFVLPVDSPIQKSGTATVPATMFSASSDRPRQLPWPPTSYSRSITPPPAGNPSQGLPMQIKFASNAVSGSAWERSAAASLTPPGSERFPKGGVTPPLTPSETQKLPK